MLNLAPSCGIGGRGRRAERPALPPLDSNGTTVWLPLHEALAFSRWWHVVNSFVPALTVGGRAMEPARRAVLRRQRHHWSLPQPLLPMPGASERLLSMCHMDGLHLRICRSGWFKSTSKYPLEAFSELRTMDRTRACVLVALRARFSRRRFCADGDWPRRWCQGACAVQPERARSA